MQDRDAARPLLWNLRRAFPSVKLAWADGGYAKLVTWAKAGLRHFPRMVRLSLVNHPASRTFRGKSRAGPRPRVARVVGDW